MNRRGFLRAVLAAPVAALPLPALPAPGPIAAFRASAVGAAYCKALTRSMMETKATLVANILNKAFCA